MKVLIWGGTGFIGSTIVDYLLNKGHKVVNVSRSRYGNELLETYTYDEEEKIIEFLKDADGAIFSAGKRLTSDFSFRDYVDNIELIRKVLETLEKSKLDNCVFLSSIGVYGDDGAIWSEDAKPNPNNLYSLSKKHQDDLVEWCNIHRETNYKIIRLAQVIGLAERKGYLFNTFFDKVSRGDAVTVYGSGVGKRQYIYIKDIARCVETLLEEKGERGIFNLGIQGSVSILDLANLMHKIFDINEDIKYKDFINEDKKTREMNVDKIYNVFNFSPQYDVEKAIIDMKDN